MKYLILSIFFLFSFNGLTQINDTLEISNASIHVTSIRNIEKKRRGGNECGNQDSTFLDYSIRHIIAQSELPYITDRNLLVELNSVVRSNYRCEFKQKVNGYQIEISILLADFDSTLNEVIFDENGNNRLINDQFPYGSIYSLPSKQIDSISIKIDGNQLVFPSTSFSNLYDPTIVEEDSFSKKIKAYSSEDGEIIYIYIYGGLASDQYFAKLIFDHNKFIAKWVADYYPLSCFGCFHENFIGF